MARNRRKGSNATVQHEAGHADVIADGDSVQQVPEGTAENEKEKRHGWINGVPATAEEVEASTQ